MSNMFSPRYKRESSIPEIIFDGSKYFQQFDVEVEILLISHPDVLCIEVIAQLERKAVRKYLDMKILISSLDMTAINESFSIKQNIALLQRVKFESGKVMRDLATTMVVKTLTERIDLTPMMNDIYFKTNPDDLTIVPLDDSGVRLAFELLEAPPGVQPYHLTSDFEPDDDSHHEEDVHTMIDSLPMLSIKTDPLTPTASAAALSGCTTSDTSKGGGADSARTPHNEEEQHQHEHEGEHEDIATEAEVSGLTETSVFSEGDVEGKVEEVTEKEREMTAGLVQA